MEDVYRIIKVLNRACRGMIPYSTVRYETFYFMLRKQFLLVLYLFCSSLTFLFSFLKEKFSLIILPKLTLQNGPLCPGGLNIPMYSCKSGFRLGGTLDFTVESDKVIDSSLITDRGTGLSSRAVRTMEGIKGTLRARDDSAYSHRRISY